MSTFNLPNKQDNVSPDFVTLKNTSEDLYLKKIYINPVSLSPEICSDIMNKFDKSHNKFKGTTLGGVNIKVKDTTDMMIDKYDSDWSEINRLLSRELAYNVRRYLDSLNNMDDFKGIYNYENDMSHYKLIDIDHLRNESFMVQKYNKNVGRYIYHHDFGIDYTSKTCRVITFLWYLNDVKIGGETTFEGTYVIKPEVGKLILFPSSWTYPHCGRMPVSDDKYIITGWIYSIN